MRLSVSQVKAIIEKCSTSTDAAEAVLEAEEVVTELHELRSRKDAVAKEYETKMKALGGLITDAQNKCGHLIRTYNGDPSGGSDSYYECSVCGKTLTR